MDLIYLQFSLNSLRFLIPPAARDSFGMTWQLGGYGEGRSGDSYNQFSFKSSIHLRIATSVPPGAPQ